MTNRRVLYWLNHRSVGWRLRPMNCDSYVRTVYATQSILLPNVMWHNSDKQQTILSIITRQILLYFTIYNNQYLRLRYYKQSCWQYQYVFVGVHGGVTGILYWIHTGHTNMAAVYRVLLDAVSSSLLLQIHDCKLDRKMVSRLQITKLQLMWIFISQCF